MNNTTPEKFLSAGTIEEIESVPIDSNEPELPLSAPEFSDENLALEFAARNAQSLRFVAKWSQWFYWTGTRWAQDDTLRARDLSRVLCRSAAERCTDPRVGKGLASLKSVTAVERLAMADRQLAATTDQWDRDLMLLNTPGGVVDLKTGQMYSHRREDFMSKVTAVAPGGQCSKWREFLDRVCGGSADLASYLQRLLGYCLTGLTHEHVLAFLFGLGANGKSVLVNTVAGILGDYHRVAPIETFTASNADRHPTELAMLRGARLVTAVETEEGRRWAESRIKTMTGGDPIPARFMRTDFFEYVPQFKLLIAGNHKPGLRSVDEAIRRRIHLVPFNVTIPPAERDPQLIEALKTEWPGILAWMVEGCLEWQRRRLAPPEAVIQATGAYLESEDSLGTWLLECCDEDVNAWTGSSDLFGSWKNWADRAGEPVGTLKRFSQSLESHGWKPRRKSHGAGFIGIQLKPVMSEMGM